jgi:hypothetical protein
VRRRRTTTKASLRATRQKSDVVVDAARRDPKAGSALVGAWATVEIQEDEIARLGGCLEHV